MNGMANIEREIFIAAPPETVFRFFVEPALMARWFGSSPRDYRFRLIKEEPGR